MKNFRFKITYFAHTGKKTAKCIPIYKNNKFDTFSLVVNYEILLQRTANYSVLCHFLREGRMRVCKINVRLINN